MDGMTRREFLGKGGQAASAVLAGTGLAMLPDKGSAWPSHLDAMDAYAPSGQFAILYDSTRCVGCRACELACNDANHLGRIPEEIFETSEEQDFRALRANVFTRLTEHRDANGEGVAFGKTQCMHCLVPACVSVCPVGAMEKTREGPVVWHADLCLGCRYCMMACPFEVPRFEWGSVNPRIRKCEMCYERLRAGEKPACVGICPSGALSFGLRGDLLSEAHRRIAQTPERYVDRVYGEREAGGTTVLHLAARPFEELGYKADLPEVSPAAATRPAMAAIPFVLNGLALLLGTSAWITRRKGLEPLQRKDADK